MPERPTGKAGQAALELTGLQVGFGGARILRRIDLAVASGDVVCIIGANGAGKTTLLRTIAGLEKPDSGRIEAFGRDITALKPKGILGLGLALVPEQGRLFTRMSVLENLMMGAYLRSDRAAVDRDLNRVYEYFPRLPERKHQAAGSLSGGERQMLAVGRALMSRPRLLLMDEPSSGLAPRFVSLLGRIILEINETGISVVLVEQNAEMALNVARYGYVMERGRITLEGRTRDLLTDDQVRTAYLGL